MVKGFINELLAPWRVAKSESKKNPHYINQHWVIKGSRYFLERFVLGIPFLKKSILNGGAQLILFIVQTILIVIGYFYNALLILFVVIFIAYLQFLSNNLITILNKNKYKALYRGISEHYHYEHGEPPDRIALTKSLCDTKNRNVKN